MFNLDIEISMHQSIMNNYYISEKHKYEDAVSIWANLGIIKFKA